MMFKSIEEKIKSLTPVELLSFLKENQIQTINDYLLFNLNQIEQEFYQNLDFLKAPAIWTKDELLSFTVVGKTIDNDYILATEKQVLVIPYSLNKEDSEIFDLSIGDFLIAFENKSLPTKILALY